MGCACGELDVGDVGSPQPSPGGGLLLAQLVASLSARLRAEREIARKCGGPKPPHAEARSFGKHACALQASTRAKFRASARRMAAAPWRMVAPVRCRVTTFTDGGCERPDANLPNSAGRRRRTIPAYARSSDFVRSASKRNLPRAEACEGTPHAGLREATLRPADGIRHRISRVRRRRQEAFRAARREIAVCRGGGGERHALTRDVSYLSAAERSTRHEGLHGQ